MMFCRLEDFSELKPFCYQQEATCSVSIREGMAPVKTIRDHQALLIIISCGQTDIYLSQDSHCRRLIIANQHHTYFR